MVSVLSYVYTSRCSSDYMTLSRIALYVQLLVLFLLKLLCSKVLSCLYLSEMIEHIPLPKIGTKSIAVFYLCSQRANQEGNFNFLVVISILFALKFNHFSLSAIIISLIFCELLTEALTSLNFFRICYKTANFALTSLFLYM